MCRASIALPGIALLFWMGPHSIAGQTHLEHRGDAIAWQYDLKAAGGTVRGLVLNEDGLPIEGVQVFTSPNFGVLTDSAGRFALEGVPPGPTVIRMSGIGMSQLDSESIVVPTDAGIWVSAVVTLSGIGGRCGDLVARGDGVFAAVTDSVTGAIPSVPLTLRLEQGDSVWETTRVLRRSEFGGTPLLVLDHRVEEVGVYAVEVHASGYERWRVEQIRMEPEYAVCARTAEGRDYDVRLVPTR